MYRMISTLSALCILCSGSASADVVIDFDGSQTPDTSVFNTRVDAGTSWASAAGELKMNTAPNVGIWFGNHYDDATYGALSWDLGSSTEGNSISVRAKVSPGSSGWYVTLLDDVYWSQWDLSDNMATYSRDNGGGVSIPIDVSLDGTDYHTYSITMVNGLVRYEVDGTNYYQGLATPHSGPNADRAVFVGDLVSLSAIGVGSLTVDHVAIRSPATIPAIPEPSSCTLLSLLVVLGIGSRVIRKQYPETSDSFATV